MTFETAWPVFVAIGAMLLSFGSVYLSYRTRKNFDRQQEILAIYTTAVNKVRKITQEAASGKPVSDYDRGHRACAYEVLWELDAALRAAEATARKTTDPSI